METSTQSKQPKVQSDTFIKNFALIQMMIQTIENNTNNNFNNPKYIDSVHDIRHNHYTTIKRKNVNRNMRAYHNISQPRWRGYSH